MTDNKPQNKRNPQPSPEEMDMMSQLGGLQAEVKFQGLLVARDTYDKKLKYIRRRESMIALKAVEKALSLTKMTNEEKEHILKEMQLNKVRINFPFLNFKRLRAWVKL